MHWSLISYKFWWAWLLQVLAEIYPQYADEEHLLIHITAGGAAGALASAVTTPLDVIKTRLQCQVSPRLES